MNDKITLEEAVDIVCECTDLPSSKEGCKNCKYHRSDRCIEILFLHTEFGVFYDNIPQIGPEEVMYYYNKKDILSKLKQI